MSNKFVNIINRFFDGNALEEEILDICNDKYILIVGSEAILNGDDSDINKYYRNELGLKSFNEIKNDKEKLKKAHKLFSEEHPNLDLSNALENLLKTRLFKTVFTTTVDRSMEGLMDKVWGKDNYEIATYSTGNVNLWKQLNEWENGKTPNPRPKLIYLFGKAREEYINDYVCHDDAAMPYIYSLMINALSGSTPPLKCYLQNKKLLTIGCNYDDWYARFFWYILTGGLISKDNTYGKIVFVPNNNNQSFGNKKLDRFLERNKIERYSTSITDFSNALTSFFNEDSELIKDLINYKNSIGGIFLSCRSTKRSDVRQLFFQLINKKDENDQDKYNVWLDDTGFTDEKYDESTANIIANCNVFIIVLTPDIKEQLENENEDIVNTVISRIKMDYSQATSPLYSEKRVLLLAVNGYNFSEDYHKKLIPIVGKRSGINLMDEGGWKQLNKFLIDNNDETKDIFISYFNKNYKDANRLFWKLHNEHFSPWLDWFDLPGTKNWDEGIEDAIKGTKVLISLLTPEVAREENECAIHYYQEEIKCAKKYNKPIIFLAINGYNFYNDYHQHLIDNINGKYDNIHEVNLTWEDNALNALINLIKNYEAL